MSDRGGTKKAGASNDGAPTLQETRDFQAVGDSLQMSAPVINDITVPNVDLDNMSPEDARQVLIGANQGKFPVRPLPHDPYDKVWSTKQGLVSSRQVNESRPLPYTEQDLAYLQGKQAAEEYAAFDTWSSQKFNLADPATRSWYQQVNPGYFETREQLIDDQINTMANYAKTRLRGPRTPEDIQLEWFIETGRLQLPRGPIWDPFASLLKEAGVDDQDGGKAILDKIANRNSVVYKAGLFSPIKAITPMANKNSPNNRMPWASNKYNSADIRGDPRMPYVSQGLGVLPPDESNIGLLYSGPDLGYARREMKSVNNADGYRDATKQSQATSIGLPNPRRIGVQQAAIPPQNQPRRWFGFF